MAGQTKNGCAVKVYREGGGRILILRQGGGRASAGQTLRRRRLFWGRDEERASKHTHLYVPIHVHEQAKALFLPAEAERSP